MCVYRVHVCMSCHVIGMHLLHPLSFPPPPPLHSLSSPPHQDASLKEKEKAERLRFGRFFYRFPNGESGADVYDRITIFEDHMIRDINAGVSFGRGVVYCVNTMLWMMYAYTICTVYCICPVCCICIVHSIYTVCCVCICCVCVHVVHITTGPRNTHALSLSLTHTHKHTHTPSGRFSNDTSLVLVTHGLATRVFLMRWFHWTVDQFLKVYNPPNAAPIVLERVTGEHECYPGGPASWVHTKVWVGGWVWVHVASHVCVSLCVWIVFLCVYTLAVVCICISVCVYVRLCVYVYLCVYACIHTTCAGSVSLA